LQQRQPGRILVCTPSNHSADEILARLIRDTDLPHHYITRTYARSIEKAHGSRYKGGVHIGTKSDMKYEIKPGLEEHSLHFKVGCVREVNALSRDLPDEFYFSAIQTKFDEAYDDAEVQILHNSRVVITTCTSAFVHTSLNKGSDPTRIKRPVNFATVIVDEAAQASEPDVILPALLARDRVVVVGDHKQLGPVVSETNLCKAYVSALETPFLERYLKSQATQRQETHTMFNVQYRMHPSIRNFPSKHFYDSRLQDMVQLSNRPLLRCIWPKKGEHVVFVDCQHPQCFGLVVEDGRRKYGAATSIENTSSLKNGGEADLVVEAYCRLLKHKACDPSEVAIITPYRAQQQEIHEKLLQKVGASAKESSVGTVHALQGSERDYIILSFVRSVPEENFGNVQTPSAADVPSSADQRSPALRQIFESNLGIVSNGKLLNVSLTRPRCGLVCIGNRTVLSGLEAHHRTALQRNTRETCMFEWHLRVSRLALGVTTTRFHNCGADARDIVGVRCRRID